MFAVKIDAAARQSGVSVSYAKSLEEALTKAAEQPALVLLDLNHARLDIIELITQLKADEKLRGLTLLGFISHVDTERRQAALNAGCNSVVPRSAFSVNLPQILKRHATSL
jgi:CheY-like chemotaxis protein